MWTLRRAVAADAAALAALGERTFRAAFEADNAPEDMSAYVARTYSAVHQAAELADPRITTLVAEHAGALVAFAQLARGEAPACVVGADPVELARFYVEPQWHGRGLAQALMRAVLDEAGAARARTVWLGVWERNARALAFYRKVGFAEVGEKVFVLGSDTQRDLVLAAPLPASR